jgi:hypothetical protein
MTRIAIDRIRADGGTQPRATIDFTVVEDYANAMADGAMLPPVIVFHDGTDHWLADGFHRREAHKVLGLPEIDCDVRQGTRRDAVLFSVSANADHGLRRTNEDKRRAVRKLLDDDEWARWSDREIARRCGVDHKTVATLRPPGPSGEVPQIDRKVERNGTVFTQNTARIGSNPAPRGALPASAAGPRPAADRPVFDATATAANAPDRAPGDPEPATEPAATPKQDAADRIRAEQCHAGIYHAVHAAIEAIDALPEPEEAARLFPSAFWHTARADDVDRVAGWWSAFAQAWRIGQPRRDSHLAHLLKTAKEQANGTV